MKKKLLFGTAAALAVTAITASGAGFAKTGSYTPGQFTDVSNDQWYASSVQSAFELGFMKGSSDTTFEPEGNMTVAEAITIAARVNDAYASKGTTFDQSGANWYDCYVKYATDAGVITATQFDNYERNITRAEMATVFAKAVPAEWLNAKNDVKEIPDVPSTNAYFDELQLLYNAGVIMGNDDFGTFKPNNNIIRAEAAAIIGRVALPEQRLSKTLVDANYGDAFYMVDQAGGSGMAGATTQYDTPWQYDNRNRTGVISNSADGTISDMYTDGKVELWRDTDTVESGLVGWEFVGNLSNCENGAYFKLTDDAKNEVVALTVKDKMFYVNGKETGVKVSEFSSFHMSMRVDLDANKVELCLYDKLVGTFDINEGAVSRMYIGIDEAGKGSITVTKCALFKDYVVNELFLEDAGAELIRWDVTGKASVVKAGGQNYNDSNSAKLESGAVAKKSFNKLSGNVVYEVLVFLEDDSSSGYIALNGDEKPVAKLTFNSDGIYNVKGEKLRALNNNIWQTLRIEADTVNGKVTYKVNGKVVYEGDFEAYSNIVDGITVGSVSGSILFDDVEVHMTHEYDDYCPTPVPVTDDGYDVILNICSLWHEGQHWGWGAESAFEDIEPALGYYDEGIVEVADWEIKFMVENGIDVQHLCWYCPSGDIKEPIKKSNMNDALHDGFFNAKYSDMMKFTFMWENNSVNAHSLEQFKQYIWDYWMEYYFTDDRFYTIDNKIVFTVWNYNNFKKTFGGSYEGCEEAIAWMNEDAKANGFDGVMIFFADQHARDAGSFANMAAVGGSAAYAYHWNQDGIYADKTIPRLQKNQDHGRIHVVPTVSVGFNNVGWSGVRKPLASLEDHKEVLEYIKNDYLPKAEAGWKQKTLIVSTWNEYGEGTYVMPTPGLHGFGYLENVAEVISGDTAHANNIFPTEQQKARLGHLYPDSKTTIKRLDRESAEEYDENTPKIIVDRKEYVSPFKPVLENDELYVAADAQKGFFSLNNLYYEWSRKTGVLYMVTKNNREITFTVDSDIVVGDGKEQKLAKPFTLRDGLPVLPLFFIYDISECSYKFEDNTVTASMVSKEYEEIVLNRVAHEFEFLVPGDMEGLRPGSATAIIENGALKGEAIERPNQNPKFDPMFTISGLNISTLECNKIVIGMKHEFAEPDKTEATLQVFFSTDTDSTLNEAKSARHKITGNSSDTYIEYVMDFSKNDTWTGNIKTIRVDPFNCGGTFEIDYIRFVIDDEMAKANEEKIAAAKKAEEERIAAGIIVANGDAENPEMATVFFGAKGNADVLRAQDGQNFVWKVTAANGKVWAYMRQNTTYTAGTKYKVTADVKILGTADNPEQDGSLCCNAVYIGADGKKDHVVWQKALPAGEWTTVEFEFEVPKDSTDRSADQFTFYTNPAGDKGLSFMLDNIVVQKQ